MELMELLKLLEILALLKLLESLELLGKGESLTHSLTDSQLEIRKTLMTGWLTDNFKSRDASASKNLVAFLINCN